MLLSTEDPVFVVDLSPAMMERCRPDFEGAFADGVSGAAAERADPPRPTEREVRAVALVLDWQQDPVLLAIEPTRDVAMLDALARLLRTALMTGQSVAGLVTRHGDNDVKRMYFAKSFPRFVYRGIPLPARKRLPREIVTAMGRG